MIGWVVDASVVVKWLVNENFSEEAAALLDGGSTCVAPALVFAEVANALWAMRPARRHCGERSGGGGQYTADGAAVGSRLHAAAFRRRLAAGNRSRPPGL